MYTLVIEANVSTGNFVVMRFVCQVADDLKCLMMRHMSL